MATQDQKDVMDQIKNDLLYENADEVIFSNPDSNGVITYRWVGGDRDGDEYFIYPNGDIIS